ncbi:hypothetical protein MYX76_14285 [Desulfobacterota bacterium AH_259_B03_O07]|nr:hypothetical protein [Desulfobacterota bacterium AH_259_B03_O07]
MKKILAMLLAILIFTSTAFAESPMTRQVTSYNPSPNALHPFKLFSIVIRPPIGLLSIFVKGGYWVLDSEPTRRAFNIDYEPIIFVDEDY